jgi:hypothetical protein
MKFKVTMQATITKNMEIEAESAEQACILAHEDFSVLNDNDEERYDQQVLGVVVADAEDTPAGTDRRDINQALSRYLGRK